jgi:hypothetical protein
MVDFDAKKLEDSDGNGLNLTPTHFLDAQGGKHSIEVEFGKKQNTISTEDDNSDIADNTVLAKTLANNKLKTTLAVRLWNYIKGKINPIKQDRLTRVELTQTGNDISTDSFILSQAYLKVLNRLGNNGNNVFVTYKVGELTEDGHWEVSAAHIDVPYALSDSKNDELHVLLDLTDAARTYPIIDSSNFLSVQVRDSGGNSLYHEDGSTVSVRCIFGKKYIFHITGNTYTVRPINSKYYARKMTEGFVDTNAWDTIGANTVDYKLCDWGNAISNFTPGVSGNSLLSMYGYQFTLVYTLSIIIENNSSADIIVAFNLGKRSTDLSQTRPVLLGCGQYAIVPANSRKYIDLSATDILARFEFANTYGPLNFYMTIDGRSWTSTDRVYVGKGHAKLIVDFLDPIQT